MASERAMKKAKEIVGKWGYEERYWWEPIATALDAEWEKAKELDGYSAGYKDGYADAMRHTGHS